MSTFICPVCKNNLSKINNSLKCVNNHCYDYSKYKYVNLLQSQKNSNKRHGDDKLMVKCRTNFLDKGFYKPLLDKTIQIINQYLKNEMFVFDSGCGECYYTSNIYKDLKDKVDNLTVCGIDISKEAVIQGMKRNHNLELAVASVNSIPVGNQSCDIILNFFAPVCESEYNRIAKNDGKIIRAIPLKNHLWELKCNIYDKPYKNDSLDLNIKGFEINNIINLKGTLTLSSNEDIQNLFKMTPYYYKTSREDQEKLKSLNCLTTTYEFGIIEYEKIK